MWAKWAKSEISKPRVIQEWAKGEPRVSQVNPSEPSEQRMSQVSWERDKSEPSQSSQPSQLSEPKSEPCEPSESSEPWVSQEWAKWAMRARWAQSEPGEPRVSQDEPRVSQECKPRVSQVSHYGRPDYSAVRCLLFGANLTDVGILRYVCLLFPDGKNILAAWADHFQKWRSRCPWSTGFLLGWYCFFKYFVLKLRHSWFPILFRFKRLQPCHCVCCPCGLTSLHLRQVKGLRLW